MMGPGEPAESELEAAWQRAVSSAAAYDDAASVEPVLEAAALCVVLELTGALARVAEGERRAVRDAARRALLRAGTAADGDDEDDVHALRLAAELAREGLRALTGEAAAGRAAEKRASAWHPPAVALVAMTRGAPDGLAAAGVALHVRGCTACAAALRLSSARAADSVQLRAAAASAAPMLAPHAGHVVATRRAPDAEAVVFEDELGLVVAIYAGEALPVRYVADGLTTEDMRPGYWAGRCAAGVARVDGTLHVGESVVPWAIDVAR